MAMLNNQRVGQIITMLEGFDLSFFSGIPIKMIKSVFVSPVLATGIPIAPSCRLLPWSTAQAATKHLPGAAGLFVKKCACCQAVTRFTTLSWDMSMVTLWLFNITMENGPFIDDFPIKTSIYNGFSMAMLNNQMVVYKGIRTYQLIWLVMVSRLRLGSQPPTHHCQGHPTMTLNQWEKRPLFTVLVRLRGVLCFWLVVEPTPLKNMTSSVGMMTFPIYGKNKKNMFQTTNQVWFSFLRQELATIGAFNVQNLLKPF